MLIKMNIKVNSGMEKGKEKESIFIGMDLFIKGNS